MSIRFDYLISDGFLLVYVLAIGSIGMFPCIMLILELCSILQQLLIHSYLASINYNI